MQRGQKEQQNMEEECSILFSPIAPLPPQTSSNIKDNKYLKLNALYLKKSIIKGLSYKVNGK